MPQAGATVMMPMMPVPEVVRPFRFAPPRCLERVPHASTPVSHLGSTHLLRGFAACAARLITTVTVNVMTVTGERLGRGARDLRRPGLALELARHFPAQRHSALAAGRFDDTDSERSEIPPPSPPSSPGPCT